MSNSITKNKNSKEKNIYTAYYIGKTNKIKTKIKYSLIIYYNRYVK